MLNGYGIDGGFSIIDLWKEPLQPATRAKEIDEGADGLEFRSALLVTLQYDFYYHFAEDFS